MASASRVREVSSGLALRKVRSALGSQGSRDMPLTTNIGREIDNTYVSIHTYMHTYLHAYIYIQREGERERESERERPSTMYRANEKHKQLLGSVGSICARWSTTACLNCRWNNSSG